MNAAPETEAQVVEAVRDAIASRAPLAIEGGGTRNGWGRPAQAASTLSLARLSGITLYEPAELVIGAHAGTPLAEVERTLAEKGQMLPFEPADYRRLYGSAGDPTIGAVAACNISGSRRISHGAARDSLIGVRFVNGLGEAVKSGGRVMKNVTGLDLVKLACGAHGTLGVLTEVTFKVLPKAQTSATLVLRGLETGVAVNAMTAALASPFEVSGAAHLPAGIGSDEARTLLRIENFETSIAYRLGALQAIVGQITPGVGERLGEEESRALWTDIGEAAFFTSPADAAVWRISTAPTRSPDLLRMIHASLDARAFFDWSGGLIWLSAADSGDAGAHVIRAAAAACGGHATLMRASPETRARVDVFEPLSAPLMKLTKGIKAASDPQGLINPGKMYAGV